MSFSPTLIAASPCQLPADSHCTVVVCYFGVTNMTSRNRTGGRNKKSPPNFNSHSSWAEGLFESFTSVFWGSKIILLDLCVHPDPSFIANLFVIVLGLHIQRPVMSLRCNSVDRRHCRTICYYTTKLTVNAEIGELLSFGIHIPSDFYVPGF